MKIKFLFLISNFLFLSSVVAAPAQAALPVSNYSFDVTAQYAGYTNASGQPADTLTGLIGKVVNIFFSAIALFFFFLMLYGGLRWMTARGNEEFSTKAKGIIEAAIIGLVIVVSSYAIAQFVLEKVG